MIHVDQKNLYEIKHGILWSLLSFKSGLLNAAGFLLAGSYVSHVTGFGTQVGIGLVHDQYKLGIEMLMIPISFILGAAFVGYRLDKNYSDDKIPDYPQVQFTITFFLGLICLLYHFQFFSEKSLFAVNNKSIILITMLCFICGLKNGLSTWTTQGKIRTTHMTGISTDIGLHLHKMFKKSNTKTRFPESKQVNIIRIMTLIFFSIGSCFSALMIPMIGYKIFYISFIMSAFFSILSYWHKFFLTKKLFPTYELGEINENIEQR